ncbi:hypothetical protein ACEQ8H_004536 [Pleosporales sp. CAS-2024a]
MFAMVHLDGSCESRVADTAAMPHTPSRAATGMSRRDRHKHPRPTAREWLASLFTSSWSSKKKRTDTRLPVSEIHMQDDESARDDDWPMRVVSPRATDVEPQMAAASTAKRSFSIKRRQSTRRPTQPVAAVSTSTAADDMVELALVEALMDANHIPVTDAPCLPPIRGECVPGLPMCTDSVTMGGAPTKNAALTSHPMTRVESSASDSSADFMTPVGGRSADSVMG